MGGKRGASSSSPSLNHISPPRTEAGAPAWSASSLPTVTPTRSQVADPRPFAQQVARRVRAHSLRHAPLPDPDAAPGQARSRLAQLVHRPDPDRNSPGRLAALDRDQVARARQGGPERRLGLLELLGVHQEAGASALYSLSSAHAHWERCEARRTRWGDSGGARRAGLEAARESVIRTACFMQKDSFMQLRYAGRAGRRARARPSTRFGPASSLREPVALTTCRG